MNRYSNYKVEISPINSWILPWGGIPSRLGTTDLDFGVNLFACLSPGESFNKTWNADKDSWDKILFTWKLHKKDVENV